MSAKRDYYEVLGVTREVTVEELRKAYKREALKHHPDRNQGDASAEGRFKETNEAYQILSDVQKRQVYDQFGHAGLEGGGGSPFDGGLGDMFSHMQDLFSEMFSGGGGGGSRSPRRGGDLRVQVRLTLKEAAFGCKREVNVRAPVRCTDCGGTGAKAGTKPETCPQCRGAGHVSNSRGFVMFTSTCPRCQGHGAVVKHHCATCQGHGAVEKSRKVMVTFPAGIDAGQRLRVPGQGLPGAASSQAGDLYVEVDVEEDARFERDGADLVTRVHVSMADAALGTEIRVPSLDDDEMAQSLGIPAGTQSGALFTMKARGVPMLNGRGRGSLIVMVQVDVPTALSARAKELLKELEDALRAAHDEHELPAAAK